MKTKIYISAFELDLPEYKGVPKRGLEFVEAIEKKGFLAYMPLEWKNYDLIEKEIDDCKALIALVDEYWTSSTWKLSELTYALDGVGVNSVNADHVPLPTFIFLVSEEETFNKRWTKNMPVILAFNIGEAVSQVENALENK